MDAIYTKAKNGVTRMVQRDLDGTIIGVHSQRIQTRQLVTMYLYALHVVAMVEMRSSSFRRHEALKFIVIATISNFAFTNDLRPQNKSNNQQLLHLSDCFVLFSFKPGYFS